MWWLTVMLGAAVALAAADRLARRSLLPLAALLDLSLAFPGRAPSRSAVAFRAATALNARRRLQSRTGPGPNEDPFRAAVMAIALVGAMTSHCRCTRGHSERVRAFGDLLAEQMRLPEPDRDRLRWAALLHDVGKLHVPRRILDKPGSPSVAEWEALKLHPAHGARMAASLRQWLGPWADAIEQHHERWDGKGYPGGLAGERISLAARVVAVIDAFDVMTAARPYQRPVSVEKARQELARKAAGSQFDPAVVRDFLNIPTRQLRKVVSPVAFAVQLPLLALVPRVEVAAAMAREGVTALGAATAISVMGVTGAIDGQPVPPPPPSHVAQPSTVARPGPAAAARAASQASTAAAPSEVPPAIAAAPAAAAPAPAAPSAPRQTQRPKVELPRVAPTIPLPQLPDSLDDIEALIPERPPADLGSLPDDLPQVPLMPDVDLELPRLPLANL
jgi:putative nucleotidyltransferase with HDIG domain